MKRQKIRIFIIFISLLLFPITMWYFSPAIIINGMLNHILNGSFFLFCGLLIFSSMFGRIFCAYICPSGGMQECILYINDKPAKQGKRRYIKFVIWTIWIAVLIFAFISGSGIVKADPLFMTEKGISIHEISDYIIYYSVILVLFLPSLIFGKRATCHYICWMAPFMIIGEKIGQLLHIPQLHITADESKCVSCKKCNKECVMGLDVEKLVKEKGEIKCVDCIQCGACADACPNKVLSYSMKFKNRK